MKLKSVVKFTLLTLVEGINVVKIAPEVALKFAFFEELKYLFRGHNSNREATIGERFVSGSVAGCMAQTAIYPLEVSY